MPMDRGRYARRLSIGAALLSLLTAAGCTRFASELDSMEVSTSLPPSSTMVADGEIDPDADWSCLAEAVGNPIMPPNGPPLEYVLSARDFISGQTPANLQARACFRGDIACSRPATEYFAPDAAGNVTLPLTVGFNGFLEITSDDMVPTLLVFPAPLTPELAAQLAGVAVALLPFEALLAFGAASSLELNPEAGVVSMNTYDCAGPFAPNVRLELNASAVPFTFVDGLPIAFQSITSDDGSGGFANVLPGLVVVRGYRGDSMDIVGLESVLVRPQWVTVGTLMPQFAAPD